MSRVQKLIEETEPIHEQLRKCQSTRTTLQDILQYRSRQRTILCP